MGSLPYGPSDPATNTSDSESDASNPYGGSRSSSSGGKSKSRGNKGIEKAGAGLRAAGQKMIEGSREEAMANMDRQTPVNLPSYRHGGKVRKTGLARLHKGEKVIPRGKVKKVTRAMRRSKKAKGREL